jgi:cytoskeletal protein CcmA (bactofilin family)
MATVKTSIAPMPVGADGQTTIIGPSVRVQGNLSGDEDLQVLGRVDGRIELQRTLHVSQTGIVKADVVVKNAIVSGVVVGNIRASESVEITKDGRMVGDIYAPRVIIVDGASFRGTVDMGDIANMPTRKPNQERPRPSSFPRTPTASRPGVAVTSTARPMPPPMAARPAPPPPPMPPPPPRMPPVPPPAPTEPVSVREEEEIEEDTDDDDDMPMARGLPQKSQKTRVVVKRR